MPHLLSSRQVLAALVLAKDEDDACRPRASAYGGRREIAAAGLLEALDVDVVEDDAVVLAARAALEAVEVERCASRPGGSSRAGCGRARWRSSRAGRRCTPCPRTARDARDGSRCGRCRGPTSSRGRSRPPPSARAKTRRALRGASHTTACPPARTHEAASSRWGHLKLRTTGRTTRMACRLIALARAMRAIVIREPGGPEVLELRDVPTPEPTRGRGARARARDRGEPRRRAAADGRVPRAARARPATSRGSRSRARSMPSARM